MATPRASTQEQKDYAAKKFAEIKKSNEDKIKNEIAEHYMDIHGIEGYHKVDDKVPDEIRDSVTGKLSPVICQPSGPIKLEDGVWHSDNKNTNPNFNLIVEDGNITTSPVPVTDAEFKAAVREIIRLAKAGGFSEIDFDWTAGPHAVTKDRLNMVLDIVQQEKVAVHFGKNVKGFLSNQPDPSTREHGETVSAQEQTNFLNRIKLAKAFKEDKAAEIKEKYMLNGLKEDLVNTPALTGTTATDKKEALLQTLGTTAEAQIKALKDLQDDIANSTHYYTSIRDKMEKTLVQINDELTEQKKNPDMDKLKAMQERLKATKDLREAVSVELEKKCRDLEVKQEVLTERLNILTTPNSAAMPANAQPTPDQTIVASLTTDQVAELDTMKKEVTNANAPQIIQAELASLNIIRENEKTVTANLTTQIAQTQVTTPGVRNG